MGIGELAMNKQLKISLKKAIGMVLLYAVLIFGAITMVFPYLYMVSSSFKSGVEVISNFSFYLFPKQPTLESYALLFKKVPFFNGLMNTLILEVVTLTAGTFVTTLSAFAFGKMHMPCKKVLFFISISSMMIPFVVVMIPQYKVFVELGLTDTLWPLIIPAFFGNTGFFFFLVQYLSGISTEYFEAAKIDGAGYFTQYFKIMIPLCMPAISVQIIFWFLGVWNDVLGPDIYLKQPEKKTLQVLIKYLDNNFGGGTLVNQPIMMAAAFLSSIPVLAIYIIFQKKFIKALLVGGIKG